jgi:dihydrofolate reductase
MLSILIAVDDDGAIGIDGELPWKDSRDMVWFQNITFGKTLIVGRKTSEKLPKLPGREVIVLTREKHERTEIEKEIDNSNWTGLSKMEKEFIVIGGAEIYKQAQPYADFYYIRHVKGKHKADTYCPFPVPWTNFTHKG